MLNISRGLIIKLAYIWCREGKKIK